MFSEDVTIPFEVDEELAGNVQAATNSSDSGYFVKNGDSTKTIDFGSFGITTYYEGTYTRYSRSASCLMYKSGEFNIIEKQILNNELKKMHPSWEYLDSSSAKYNCHAYCWIADGTATNYWLSYPHYLYTASIYTATAGNTRIPTSDLYIIIYKDGIPIHSVISTSASLGNTLTMWMSTAQVKSKLGAAPVFKCSLRDIYEFYEGTSYRVYIH